MTPRTLKTFLDVHSWTGLGAGMALFIAFYAGAITVFTEELDHWDNFASTHLEEPQDLTQAQALMDEALAHTPDAAGRFRLTLAGRHGNEHLGRWFERDEDGNFHRHEFRLTESGELSTDLETTHLANFIYRLHYTAGLPNRLGLYTLGIICILYGIALISGIVIFAPNFLKDLFVVREGKNNKRFWMDTHNVVGVISLPWHFMFAWSSAVLAIGIFFIAPFQLLVFDDDLVATVGPELGVGAPAVEASGNDAPYLDVATLVALAQAELPGLEVTQLRYNHAGDENGNVTVFGYSAENTLVSRGSVALSTASGEVLNVTNPADATPGFTFYRGLISLHFADFAGVFVRWIYFFMGLGGAFLFYSGNLLWIERRRKRRQLSQPKSGRFLARLNSGVCIGAMAGISAAFVASRLSSGSTEQELATELTYYLVFAAAIIWAFIRPVARGARDLLLACAAFTTAIPFIDALLVHQPLWKSLAQGEMTMATVDVLALLFALLFWRMARAVERRALFGGTNSVWSAYDGQTLQGAEPASVENSGGAVPS